MWMTGAYCKANTVSDGARISNMGQCGPHTCASRESILAPMYIGYLHRAMSHLGMPYGVPVKAKHKRMAKCTTTCSTGGAMCISSRAHAAKHNCFDTEPHDVMGKLSSLGQESARLL